MFADITKVAIDHSGGKYKPIFEFETRDLERYDTLQECIDFAEGYAMKMRVTENNIKGWIYRNLVEADYNDGIRYVKVREIKPVTLLQF